MRVGSATGVRVGSAASGVRVGRAASMEVWPLARRAREERMRGRVKIMAVVSLRRFVCGVCGRLRCSSVRISSIDVSVGGYRGDGCRLGDWQHFEIVQGKGASWKSFMYFLAGRTT